MKVYRKVKVSERLPLEDGHYITDLGVLELRLEINLWQDVEYDYCYPEYWLEEVELPNEDEIMNEENKQFSNIAAIGFNNGANYILNKLK